MMKSIDLNADLGEGCKYDNEILKYVSSANIACGMHAGSPLAMIDTLKMAISNNVSLGAHPGYPDREGFGRVNMDLPPDELRALLLYQIGALYAMSRAEGGTITHVKAHGALYNSAATDSKIASVIVSASREIDPGLIIFGPAGTFLETESARQNMRFCSEVFADRAYMNDGSLVPRSREGAVIESREECAERTLDMINNNFVTSISGKKIAIKAETVCLHGDSDSALDFAKYLNKTLGENNILIRAHR